MCETMMVTVCQPTPGYGSNHYGHNYCTEVSQETCYNVPIVTPAVNVIPKQVCKEINYGYTYNVADNYSKPTPQQATSFLPSSTPVGSPPTGPWHCPPPTSTLVTAWVSVSM
jgi:hypothetical protein